MSADLVSDDLWERVALVAGVVDKAVSVSLFRFDGHLRCVGQAARAVSHSAGLR